MQTLLMKCKHFSCLQYRAYYVGLCASLPNANLVIFISYATQMQRRYIFSPKTMFYLFIFNSAANNCYQANLYQSF